MNFIALPLIVVINAFLTGLFTKLSDVVNDDGLKVPTSVNILFGILWGVFGSLVVLGNPYVAAFYFGILLSWIHRFKLDNYSHGFGGSLILASIFFIHPSSQVQIVIIIVTAVLFTFFGLLSRHGVLKKNIFINYNVYSFLFLIIVSFYNKNVWVVVVASLANVFGYHGVKQWWKYKSRLKS